LAVAEANGVDVEIELYLKTKPDVAELTALLGILEDPPGDLVRKDKFFQDQGFDEADYQSAAAVAALLAEHPRLIQRPVLVRGKKAIIGRPKSRIDEFLAS
jgi:arsenate reductase